MPDGRFRGREAPAIGKGIGSYVQHTHDGGLIDLE
jgi:hypothetical protein